MLSTYFVLYYIYILKKSITKQNFSLIFTPVNLSRIVHRCYRFCFNLISKISLIGLLYIIVSEHHLEVCPVQHQHQDEALPELCFSKLLYGPEYWRITDTDLSHYDHSARYTCTEYLELKKTQTNEELLSRCN